MCQMHLCDGPNLNFITPSVQEFLLFSEFHTSKITASTVIYVEICKKGFRLCISQIP